MKRTLWIRPHAGRLACLVVLLWPIALMAQPQVAGCPIFPAKNIWNVPIDTMPVHALSAQFIGTEGAGASLHPDFGPQGGLPFTIVPADQAMVPIQFDSLQSDPGPYPIPNGTQSESNPDLQLVILQQGTCKLYEVWAPRKLTDGTWTGGSGAIWGLKSNALRPDGWTSADGAGLPMFAGLVRYDEVASGAIRHALRMGVPKTRDDYVWPARHLASNLDGDQYPPMGTRFRLKASVDISHFDPMVQVILQALKTYGAMVAENGSAWFITGAPDSHWDNDILAQIKQLHGSDLEAVDVSSLQMGPNSALALDLGGSDRWDVPFSATPVFDLSRGDALSITLTGDVTSSTMINAGDGQTVSFLICQDSAGARAFHWPSNVLSGMQIGTASKSCSAQTFVSDGVKLYATTPGVINLQ